MGSAFFDSCEKEVTVTVMNSKRMILFMVLGLIVELHIEGLNIEPWH